MTKNGTSGQRRKGWKVLGYEVMFRTFLKGSGKSPSVPKGTKLKGKTFQTLEQVQDQKSYGGLLQKGFIDISFDTDELSQSFWEMAEGNDWNCAILENPDNGHLHSFWKIPKWWDSRDGKDKKLAVGLIADIHSGDTYIPLKVNGVQRDLIFDPDVLQEVPEELCPVTTSIKLFGLSEGSGRNEELFKYILILQGKGMDRETIRRILDNTNNYVFADPIGQQEFETITREEAFEAPVFYDGKKFLHNNFGKYIQTEYHIKRINGQLHVYDKGIYKSGYRYIENKMIEVLPMLKSAQRIETLKYLEIITPDETPASGANLIAFKNGVYDLATDELVPFSPDMVITNMIPWDYNDRAYSELADQTLDKISCQDPEIRSLLEECIGYCFYRHNELSKSFILTGEGANGKSTYLDMVSHVLGNQNTSSLDLCELSERFSVSSMFNKLANIGDDISDEFLQGTAVSHFKKIVSGNSVKAENKGQDVFFYKPYTKLLFSANEIPRMRNKGFSAIKRRLVIIPFNAHFSKDDPDYDSGITWKLKTEEVAEYLIRLGIEGLKRVLDQQSFTESQKVKEQIDQFEKDNNPVLMFLEEVPEDQILNHETKEVYARYDTFCYENGFQRIAMQTFTKEMKKNLDCDRKDIRRNGKKVIIFKR